MTFSNQIRQYIRASRLKLFNTLKKVMGEQEEHPLINDLNNIIAKHSEKYPNWTRLSCHTQGLYYYKYIYPEIVEMCRSYNMLILATYLESKQYSEI